MAEIPASRQRSSQGDDVRRFFSAFAAQWDSLYGGRRNVFWRAFDHAFRRDVSERYQLTFEQLDMDLTGTTVLDIGCGSGIYCLEAVRRGAARVVGIDIADDMIALARERCAQEGRGDVCEFVIGEFPPKRAIPHLSMTCDYAIVMGVMDYVPDANAFVAALRPLVRRSAIISFPGRHWLRGPLRQYRYRALGRCAVYNYDQASVVAACTGAGFRKVQVKRLPHSGICYIVSAQV